MSTNHPFRAWSTIPAAARLDGATAQPHPEAAPARQQAGCEYGPRHPAGMTRGLPVLFDAGRGESVYERAAAAGAATARGETGFHPAQRSGRATGAWE